MRPLLVVVTLLSTGASNAHGQIPLLTVSGSPSAMTVSVATAGSQPNAVSDNSTTYSALTVLLAPKKITAQVNSNMPTGVTLTITLAATTGAISAGAVALDAVARDVVTNLTNTLLETKGITYRLSATVAAGVVLIASRTVTLTLTAYP